MWSLQDPHPFYSTVLLPAALPHAPATGNLACTLEITVKNYKIDGAGKNAAVRTACALMSGNSFVPPLLFSNREWKNIATFLGLGVVAVTVTVVERRS